MERSVTVRTPEAIAFYYELAGLGSRFLALLVDMIVQVVTYVLVIIAGSAGASRASALASSLHVNQKWFASAVLAVAIILAFVVFFGYFIIFEKLWNGQTPGKRLLGIRVVRDGGYPVGLVDSTIRNLIRILELVLGFYFLSAMSMLLSSENKRLGDFAAGTIVVRDKAFEVPDPKAWLRSEATQAQAAGDPVFSQLTSDELALVDRYMARRSTLSPSAAKNAAAKIAAALRPRLGDALASLTDDELLMKIAAR